MASTLTIVVLSGRIIISIFNEYETVIVVGHRRWLIKRGVEGSVLLHQRTVKTQPAFLTDRFIDAIGAGDSFNAGFIHQFLRGKPPDACQRFANLAGSISTTAPGGTGAFDGSIDIHSLAREKYGYAEDQSKK